mgnify:CR=1 FL=1
MRNPEKIIMRPLLTEKGTTLEETEGKYMFEVALDANKVEVRKAVEKIYDVTVAAVNTQVVRGKEKRVGRSVGYRRKWKKAIVSLVGDATIDFFSPE